MNDNLEYMIEEAGNSIQRKIINKLIAGAITFVVMVVLGLIYCFYSGVFLFGFGNKQPVSIEIIGYEWKEGTEETILFTDNEEILELYDAIRHAKIQEVQFDSEGLETDGDWAVVLHFDDEDVRLDTQGEGMKDSLYFRRYLNQKSTDDFFEVWLDNSKLMDILCEYE